jgi:hypothetical protein
VRPVVPWLVLLASVFLWGCAAMPGRESRQPNLSDLLLKLDASEEAGGDPSCRNRSVATTAVVGAVEQGSQGASTRWAERWTVDRCGSQVPYLVKFARSPEGDLDVTMQLETPVGESGTVPGKTIADPVLQRDALGFLAQRDFSVAGAEATCQARKVIDTEMLQPLEDAAVQDGRPISGRWTERWTLDRCGKPVRYVLRFSTTQKGTTFKVDHEQ